MADRVIIANLPTIHQIDRNSYLIVEKPGYQDGTFKTTVSDLQDAISVHAAVTRNENTVTITIRDMNGQTSEDIVVPTATIQDNGDNTLTITITDTNGTTQSTIVQNTAQFDPQPTEGSSNLLTSGTIYTALASLVSRISDLETALGGISFQLVQ